MSTPLVYVCLDGLGDDPIPEFDGRTPLEAAQTPALDALAARGRTGTVLTVGPGIAPESDIGVFGILGYDPKDEHPGRGVLEALGSDMDLRDGDLAYRTNFATQEHGEIIDRRVARLGPAAHELLTVAAVIGQDVPIPLWQTVERVGVCGMAC